MTKLVLYLQRIMKSPGTKPALTVWVSSGLTASAFLAGWLSFGASGAIMTGILVAVVMTAFKRDLNVVQDLVNDASTSQSNRITQLTAALEAEGIQVPSAPIKGSGKDGKP